MALQGTIETFALPDVMRLLASTKKTGCLRLEGTRGSGSIWVDGGAVVASEVSTAPHADGATEVVFELLRFKDGDFVFDADVTADSPGTAQEVEPILGDAEKLLEEWKSIEAVVPSLDAWVSLAEELGSDEVTVSKDRWRLIVAIGGGTSVGALGDVLELGELPVSRVVKELVEAGLVSVGEAPAGATVAAAAAEVPTVVDEPEPADVEPQAAAVEVVDEVEDEYEPFDPDGLVIERDAPLAEETADLEPADLEPADLEPAGLDSEAPAAAAALGDDPGDASEIASQLMHLSPKAAKAVAAAAKATTQEEREAALAEVDDDSINRELLIKFLGSVNG